MKRTTQWIILMIGFLVISSSGILLWQIKIAETPLVRQSIQSTPDFAQAECKRLGIEHYSGVDLSDWFRHKQADFSFCYRKLWWGDPNSSASVSHDGKSRLFHMSFSKGSGPTVWWYDSKAADRSWTLICFDCIDFEKSESEIIRVLGLQKQNATVKKVIVAGKNALRVHLDYFAYYPWGEEHINELKYLVPNAFEKYHLEASIQYDYASELDSFMESILFE